MNDIIDETIDSLLLVNCEKEEKCPMCKSEMGSEIKLIECERCLLWVCDKCHGFNKAALKVLKQPGLHWVCKKCDEYVILKHAKANENLTGNLENENATLMYENENLRLKLNECKIKVKKGISENESLKAQLVGLTTKKKEVVVEKGTSKDHANVETDEGKQIKQLKKDTKKKDTEINKLKKEISELMTEIDNNIGELRHSKETNSNLNTNIDNLKEVNKKLELRVTEKAKANENDWNNQDINYDSQRDKYDQDQESKTICRNFAKNGQCRFGSKCRYKHSRNQVCKFYEQNRCKFGKKCRYLHEEHNLSKQFTNENMNRTSNNSTSRETKGSQNKVQKEMMNQIDFLGHQLNTLIQQMNQIPVLTKQIQQTNQGISTNRVQEEQKQISDQMKNPLQRDMPLTPTQMRPENQPISQQVNYPQQTDLQTSPYHHTTFPEQWRFQNHRQLNRPNWDYQPYTMPMTGQLV